jgi:hypothetical protein
MVVSTTDGDYVKLYIAIEIISFFTDTRISLIKWTLVNGSSRVIKIKTLSPAFSLKEVIYLNKNLELKKSLFKLLNNCLSTKIML